MRGNGPDVALRCGTVTHAYAAIDASARARCCFCSRPEIPYTPALSVISFRPNTAEAVTAHPQHWICAGCYRRNAYDAARRRYWANLNR